jgi:hypothetical protein
VIGTQNSGYLPRGGILYYLYIYFICIPVRMDFPDLDPLEHSHH